jgi:hypothetical protein
MEILPVSIIFCLIFFYKNIDKKIIYYIKRKHGSICFHVFACDGGALVISSIALILSIVAVRDDRCYIPLFQSPIDPEKRAGSGT